MLLPFFIISVLYWWNSVYFGGCALVGDFRYLAKMLMDVLALTKSGGGEGELHCLNLDMGKQTAMNGVGAW